LKFGNDTQNSLACRFSVLGDPSIRSTGTLQQLCAGAGPAGDFGSSSFKCGKGICESYCALLRAGCPTEFGSDYPSGPTQCFTDCNNTFPSAGVFAWEPTPSANDLACRIHEAMAAITDQPSAALHCSVARVASVSCP
jgi:hypothetical protein